MIRAILACDSNKGIGRNGTIPWKHKDDMRFFKMATIGHGNNIVVMGRKTMVSLPTFPLPDRKNIVISSRKDNTAYDCFMTFETFKKWLKIPKEKDLDDIYIIGGASIYHQCFKERIPQEIYITILDDEFECDTFIDFDIIEKNYQVNDVRKIEDYTFQIWERK